MTYCLGIITKNGLIMASDSRTNAGYDQANVCRKMHTFVHPGERVFVVLASGSLSCSQSVITMVQRDFELGKGLATAPTLYDAARVIGDAVRKVAEVDRPALERDDFHFNVHFILGGQIKGQPHGLFMIYPQGNPLQASEDSPYLQIGEVKYGRPILDRGISYQNTTLEQAAKYALLSLDSTMRSNVTVGPPIDLLAYNVGEFDVSRHRRFGQDDPDLVKIRTRWDQVLRQAVKRLPDVHFRAKGESSSVAIALVDDSETTSDLQSADQSQASASAPSLPRPSGESKR
jgi:putative proteasome-type protease